MFEKVSRKWSVAGNRRPEVEGCAVDVEDAHAVR
jgi:hypothetical protein